MKTTEQKVLKFINEKKLITAGDKILVALSGGPDSVFALTFLHKFSKRLRITLAAAHLNHNLRENAKAEEVFCLDLCDRLGVEFHSLSLDIKKLAKKTKLSIEETARNERYKYFERLVTEINAGKIVTAHNKNDNLETVLLNLFKGTGIRGLSGIPVKREKIIRPMLNLTKEEILKYLDENKIQYRIDESNFSDDYQRNLIRNKIIPVISKSLNPNIEEAVFRTSQIITGHREFLNDFLFKIIKSKIKIEKGEIFIPVELFNRFGVFIISELIILLAESKYGIKLNYENLKQVNSLFEKQKGRELELSGSLYVLRDSQNLVLYQKVKSAIFEEIKIMAGDKTNYDGMEISIEKIKNPGIIRFGGFTDEIISADNTDNIFILRRWKNADKFIPLGMKNFKKVSDFLTDIKIPAREKKKQLVLTSKKEIVWIVGRRIDERFKVNDTSKNFYRLCLK
jgi:tRNA(Ile)-lysidine synthase